MNLWEKDASQFQLQLPFEIVLNSYLTQFSPSVRAVRLLQVSLFPVASLLDYKAFQEAAEHFQPYIKFFATFDKGVSTFENHFNTFSGMNNSSPSSFFATCPQVLEESGKALLRLWSLYSSP